LFKAWRLRDIYKITVEIHLMTSSQIAAIVQSRFYQSAYSFAEHIGKDPAIQRMYIQDARRRFSNSLCEPSETEISVDEFHAAQVGLRVGTHRFWTVSVEGSSQVFYDEAKDTFGKADRIGDAQGVWVDIGHRSPDPFEIYLV
jgi:hypothetical protein